MGLASAATAASETEPGHVQASRRDVQKTAGRVEKAAGAATKKPIAPRIKVNSITEVFSHPRAQRSYHLFTVMLIDRGVGEKEHKCN